MFYTALMFAVVSAVAVSSASATNGSSEGSPRVVALGDSLTSGHGIGAANAYPAVLQQRLAASGLDFQMVNAGISGDTSEGALRRLDRALSGNVRVLIVALGANDGLRGVPVATLKANLTRIIRTAQARGITVVLCGMETLPIRGREYSIAFHNVYRDLAATYKVTLVPFMLTNVVGNPALMLPDRAHPNAAGARVIANHIWPYLAAALGSVAAQH